MSSKPCRQETLACHPAALVQRCQDCGCVSLHVGPFTLRLDGPSLKAVSAALQHATSTLQARRDGAFTHDPSPRGEA
jgi:hypothetical protein